MPDTSSATDPAPSPEAALPEPGSESVETRLTRVENDAVMALAMGDVLLQFVGDLMTERAISDVLKMQLLRQQGEARRIAQSMVGQVGELVDARLRAALLKLGASHLASLGPRIRGRPHVAPHRRRARPNVSATPSADHAPRGALPAGGAASVVPNSRRVQ